MDLTESRSRVVLITGASQGIGAAAAQVFADEGARLVLNDFTDDVESVAAQVVRNTPSASAAVVVADISDPVDSDRLVAETVKLYGALDVVIHATAAMQQVGPVATTDSDDWDRVMSINAKGAFLLSRSALPRLTRPGGRIVFTGSATGQVGQPFTAAYSASKGALRAFTHSLAIELARDGITVNGVAPAHVEAAMNDAALERTAESTGRSVDEVRRERDSGIPLGRQASAHEVALAMQYLASPAASYITGSWLDINGGVLLR